MKTWTVSQTDEGFELTPMIDVVFLLIAFFMMITSEITDENIKIDVPIAEEALVPDERGARQNISINEEGQIFFGARQMAPDELAGAIQRTLQINPDTRIYLRADAAAAHRHVQDVMRATANAGIYSVIFASNQE